MKLLGWMHRKFRQNGNDPFKDLSIGRQQSLDEQLQCPRLSNYCNKPLIKEYKDNDYQHRKSLTSPDQAARTDQEDPEDERLPEIFHGFLAIGTFGMDPLATPTFSVSVENIMEKETQVTEEELKIINEELEKVLAVDESCNVSSGRNSYVSAGRSSHCSTITLNGNPRESTESKESGAIACPLQSYLLGSAMEYQETSLHSAAKKEHRSSLGELFEKTELTEPKDYALKSEFVGNKMEKESDKSAASLLKKMLKKKIHHASILTRNEASGGTSDSVSSETKLHKILQIFNRKVHPASSTEAKKSIKTWVGLKASMRAGSRAYQHTGHEHSGPEEDITIIPGGASSYEKICSCKSQSNPGQITLDGGIGPGEHWIKSDSDYLVLEL